MKTNIKKTKEQLLQELEEAHEKIKQLALLESLAREIAKALPDQLTLIGDKGIPLNFNVADWDYTGPSGISVTPEIQAAIRQATEKALTTGSTQIITHIIETENGERWIESRISPLPPRSDHHRELIMISRDITEHRIAEEQLRESERKYRTLVENIPEKIVLKDKDHWFISCNTEFATLHNRTPEDIAGTHTDDLYPPELAARLKSVDDEVMRTGQEVLFTDQIGSGDDILYFESKKTPVRDSSGNITGTLSILRDVTELKKHEEALRFSDAALKSIKEGVYAMDADFNVTYWNHICEEMFGIPASEAIGTNIRDLINMKEDYPGHNEARLKTLLEDGFNREEQIYITPAGEIWVDIFAQAIEQDGVRQGWITLANDISERKQFEESLRISEERFSKAFRSVPDGIIISRKDDGLYFEVNDAFTKMTGFRRNEVLGRTSRDLGIWFDLADRERALAVIEAEGRVENFEHKYRKKSGEVRIGIITIEPIDINGVPCIISVLTDITERKTAEEQVKYQASLVENVTEAIISHDDHLKILSWNSAAETIFGVKKEDIIGKDIRSLCEIEPVGGNLEHIKAAINGRGYWKGEALHHLKDGRTIHMRVSTMVVKDAEKGTNSYVLIMSDITEEKKAEAELKQLYKQEIALRRELENEMKKRSEFSAAIVHELKTPLTAIISSSELMVETTAEGPQKRMAKNINQSAYELDKRTNELLDMTKGELGILAIEKKPLNLADMMSSMEMEFKTMLSRKEQTFTLEMTPDLPEIEADEGRIRQVIYNLINNAHKYTLSGGKVTLKLSDQPTNILVEVRDTGSGLTKKEMEYVFEPYRQLIEGKRVEGGMGLGLAISRNLVTAHGGRIWVESKKGKGSSFFFTIPKSRAK